MAVKGPDNEPSLTVQLEQIGMSAGPDQLNGFIVHGIDEDPIRRSVAVPGSSPIANQPVWSCGSRHFAMLCDVVNDVS